MITLLWARTLDECSNDGGGNYKDDYGDINAWLYGLHRLLSPLDEARVRARTKEGISKLWIASKLQGSESGSAENDYFIALRVANIPLEKDSRVVQS